MNQEPKDWIADFCEKFIAKEPPYLTEEQFMEVTEFIESLLKEEREKVKDEIREWAKKNIKEIDDAGHEMGGTSEIIWPDDLLKFLDYLK